MLACTAVPVESPHPWVDVSRYPVVVIAFPLNPSTAAVGTLTLALRRFAADLTESIGLITDLSNLRTTDPDARAIYTSFVRDMRAVSGRYIAATAVIAKHPIHRAMLNLHALMVGATPYPVRSFARVEDAYPWVQARLSVAH